MATKVFISSVTAGLIQERTAVPGLGLGLGMEPVRFEDFTAAPMPSREVCLRAVAESDVYLLLLGEHYCAPFPDTGLRPRTRSGGSPARAARRSRHIASAVDGGSHGPRSSGSSPRPTADVVYVSPRGSSAARWPDDAALRARARDPRA